MFDKDFIFVPFGVSRSKVTTGFNVYIGYTHYHIFGFRIAMIQETRPY